MLNNESLAFRRSDLLSMLLNGLRFIAQTN